MAEVIKWADGNAVVTYYTVKWSDADLHDYYDPDSEPVVSGMVIFKPILRPRRR